MITRKEVDKRLKASEGMYTSTVVQMLDEEAAKYQTLVNAVISQRNDNAFSNSPQVNLAIQSFLPPPKLSEKLDRLADIDARIWVSKDKLHEMAAEARELEKA